jgi:hypothetical protein
LAASQALSAASFASMTFLIPSAFFASERVGLGVCLGVRLGVDFIKPKYSPTIAKTKIERLLLKPQLFFAFYSFD